MPGFWNDRTCLLIACNLLAGLALNSCSSDSTIAPPVSGMQSRTVLGPNMQVELPSILVEAHHYCDGLAWRCYGSQGEYQADLLHPQINENCYINPDNCTFTISGLGNYANPSVDAAPTATDNSLPPRPSCSPEPSNPRLKAWCIGVAPASGSEAWARIRSAVNNMRRLGGPCSTLSDIIDQLISRGDLHVYPESVLKGEGGFAPQGGGAEGVNSFMGISDYFTRFAYDERHVRRGDPPSNLQFVLAHEADHLLNSPHISTYLTTNTEQCSGL